MALKPDSGVDKAKVKEINNAGKAIAEQMDAIHEAGEKKDTAAAKAAFAKGKAQIDSLAAAAPAKYFCPMHCEGARPTTSPASARSAT
jgi:DNA polymerase/3'-5' exonuclease PolX